MGVARMTVLDSFAFVWLVGGTLLVKRAQRAEYAQRARTAIVLLIAFAGAVPAVLMNLEVAAYSAVGVVSAGVVPFWFAILASRVKQQ